MYGFLYHSTVRVCPFCLVTTDSALLCVISTRVRVCPLLPHPSLMTWPCFVWSGREFNLINLKMLIPTGGWLQKHLFSFIRLFSQAFASPDACSVRPNVTCHDVSQAPFLVRWIICQGRKQDIQKTANAARNKYHAQKQHKRRRFCNSFVTQSCLWDLHVAKWPTPSS